MSTHQQLLYHIVFSTKARKPHLSKSDFREEVWRYMAGVTVNLESDPLQIGGYFDHAHLLVRIPAKLAVSDFVRQLKSSTSKYINDLDAYSNFHWQDGYGAFTVSRSKMATVMRYIERQAQHHRKQTFQEEYLIMVKKHEVEYDPKYLWE